MKIKKILCVLLIFISCKDEIRPFNRFNLYEQQIEIPNNYFKVEVNKTSQNNCYEGLFLKDSIDSCLNIRVCSYGYSYRKSFEKLNMFIEERYNVLKEERSDLTNLKFEALKEGMSHYFYSYEFLVDGKFYRNVYVAYQDYYLSIRFSTPKTNEIEIEDFRSTVTKIKNNQGLTKLNLPDEFETGCSSCKYPYFW